MALCQGETYTFFQIDLRLTIFISPVPDHKYIRSRGQSQSKEYFFFLKIIMCKAHKYQWKWVLFLFIQESNNTLTLFSFSNSTRMKTGQKSGALCSDNRSRLWPWNPADNLELGFFPPYFLRTIPTLSHCFWSQGRLPP